MLWFASFWCRNTENNRNIKAVQENILYSYIYFSNHVYVDFGGGKNDRFNIISLINEVMIGKKGTRIEVPYFKPFNLKKNSNEIIEKQHSIQFYKILSCWCDAICHICYNLNKYVYIYDVIDHWTKLNCESMTRAILSSK